MKRATDLVTAYRGSSLRLLGMPSGGLSLVAREESDKLLPSYPRPARLRRGGSPEREWLLSEFWLIRGLGLPPGASGPSGLPLSSRLLLLAALLMPCHKDCTVGVCRGGGTG